MDNVVFANCSARYVRDLPWLLEKSTSLLRLSDDSRAHKRLLSNHDTSLQSGGALYTSGSATITNSLFTSTTTQLVRGRTLAEARQNDKTNHTAHHRSSVNLPRAPRSSEAPCRRSRFLSRTASSSTLAARRRVLFERRFSATRFSYSAVCLRSLRWHSPAQVGARCGGGAIYSSGAATVATSAFVTATAASGGGAVCAMGALSIQSSTFDSCSSTGGDGGASSLCSRERVTCGCISCIALATALISVMSYGVLLTRLRFLPPTPLLDRCRVGGASHSGGGVALCLHLHLPKLLRGRQRRRRGVFRACVRQRHSVHLHSQHRRGA